jgi:hypothetical protein
MVHAPMKDDNIEAQAASVAAKSHSASGAAGGAQYVLSSIRYWDVQISPTKRYMVAGYFVPSVKCNLPFLTKKRRITVELYKSNQHQHHDNVDEHNTNTEQTKHLFGQLLKGISSSSLMQVQAVDDNDLISFRILKPKLDNDPNNATSSADDGDWDAHSIGSLSLSTLGFGSQNEEDDLDLEAKNIRWKERYRCRLDTLEIVSQKGRACDLKLGADDGVILKTINFESNHDLQTFTKVLEQMNQLREERGRRLASSYLEKKSSPPRKMNFASLVPGSLVSNPFRSTKSPDSPSQQQIPNSGGGSSATKKVQISEGIEDVEVSIDLGPDEMGLDLNTDALSGTDVEEPFNNLVQILVEIVSAANLPVADIMSSDPYIKVYDGSNEIHRTDVAPKTLNPVWTVGSKSLFLIHTTVENYFAGSNFITFDVKDYDAFKKNNSFGTVDISKETLLKGNGDRMIFDILPPGKGEMKRKKWEGSVSASPTKNGTRLVPFIFFTILMYSPKVHSGFAISASCT